MSQGTCKAEVTSGLETRACSRKIKPGQEFCTQHWKPTADTKVEQWWVVNKIINQEELNPVNVVNSSDRMVTLLVARRDGSMTHEVTHKVTTYQQICRTWEAAHEFQLSFLSDRVRTVEIALENAKALLGKAKALRKPAGVQ